MANLSIKSIVIGFAAGLAVAAAAAQAGQPSEAQPAGPHDHGQAQTAPPAPGQAMPQGGMMDPAMHRQMMERMHQCHETMAMMMRHMEDMGPRHAQPSQRP